ncbi:Uncharacterized protein Fot_14479 [Forsythia ovata]|uniref:Uncharacterized protein n=1 Tax=Forsythia ovata TaxID=205694 RepID=A0ABD1W6G1_9LAMI
MNLICRKKRPNSSHVSPATKMSRVTSTNMPHQPQTSRSNSTSTNRFVAPLSLRYSLQANRVVPSFSQTSQSPNTSIPPTSKIGTQSTIETIPTCSTPLIETLRTRTQPEAPSRTLPNPSAQYGPPSSDNFDRPTSRHPGCEQGSAVGSESLPRTPNDVPTRGSCKQIKTSRIVRTTREKIRVIYNSVSRRATSSIVHSLLVHDIGAIIRSHCPMNTCYWRTISSSEKKDLMGEITTNFEIDSKDSRLTNYVNRLYNGRYREFKAELSSYYKLHKTHEDALANPPIEMLDRGVDQWVELCNHFNSDKFRKSSFANIENRSKKKYNHRTGSRPLSYIVEEMAVGRRTKVKYIVIQRTKATCTNSNLLKTPFRHPRPHALCYEPKPEPESTGQHVVAARTCGLCTE